MARDSLPRRRITTVLAALTLASGTLAACSAEASTPTLVWYINPDNGGQAALAENCSTGDYTISTQVLPQASDQQRIQLARRLAAEDSAIDLMSLDPPFTAEFASAGFLEPVPDEARQQLEEQGTFAGAMDAATWDDQLVVFPFWSNTQVLWYRKSFVEKAGIDMGKPVTWDQIIDSASEDGGRIGVQANKYEGYVVWINALIEGAGGHLIENADKGIDADLTVDSDEGRLAAGVIEKLASSKAAPADLSVSNEGTAGSTFGSDQGSFMVNWTYIFHNYDETDPEVAKDIGYARYPQTVEGEESRPPYGGIGIGVSAFSDHKEMALEAAQCLVSGENQGINAAMTGNMPASTEGYQQKGVTDAYPADLLDLFQESVDAAAPRSVTPYWSDISSALQSTWHPASSVDQETPRRSREFIEQVLNGRTLL
ncbi:MAG: extracellular solute-binding protein [Nocardioides sp.]|uniref:extracellular solute-binding protein n=1 Tax=Nocardioides sp. TaxID=35761 RepID=UPI003EFEC3DB